MKDFRKFCRPKIKSHPEVGDVLVKLKCGTIRAMSPEEYKKVQNFFELDSFVGEDLTNSTGNVIVKNKNIGITTVFDIETYNAIKDNFELEGIVGEIQENLAQAGDIICYSSKLDREAIFSYEDWITLDDSWNAIGLYEIETFDDDDEVTEERKVIMSNGTTFIIKSTDYSSVSSHWEVVDTISVPDVNNEP